MVDPARARGRETAWEPAAGSRPILPWPLADWARLFAKRLWLWVLADVGPGRLVPWLAIAFGFGIVIYFTAAREPALWAAAVLFGIACAAAYGARQRPIAFPFALAFAAA